LSEILFLLSKGKTFSQYELAERLNTTPELIAARLDFLHRAGNLRKICAAGDCGTKCAGCASGETPKNGAVLWELRAAIQG
jgi:DNA-binding Lrp family transcriptional regulator